jgi:hypothetical protein
MRKLIFSAALMGLATTGAYAQNGANPSAPQPSSTGAGVVTPGTTKTSEATDSKMTKGTTGSANKTGDMKTGGSK